MKITKQIVKRAFEKADRFDILEEFSDIGEVTQESENLFKIECWLVDMFFTDIQTFSFKFENNELVFINEPEKEQRKFGALYLHMDED